jgi:SRSO17 transposase
VPEEIAFATKTAIALDQIRQAQAAGVPEGIVLGDAGYGDETEFRVGVEPHRVCRRLQLLRGWSDDKASSSIFP